MKSICKIIAVAVVLTFAFGSNFSALAADKKVVEITWLQWWVNEWGEDNHAQLIKEFEKLNPGIKVKVVDVPWPDMATKLKADATGLNPKYDVLGMEIDWIASLTNLGYLEDLDSWIEKDKQFQEQMTPNTPLAYNGKIKYLALYLAPYQFVYNVDAFKKQNIAPPKNWAEFEAAMEKIKKSGKYGMSMTLQSADFVVNRYFAFKLAQLGGTWFDENGKVAINSPEAVAVLNYWKDFYAKNLVAPGSMSENQSTSLELLATEQVLSIIDGPFILTKAKQINPDINLAYAPPWKDKTGGYAFNTSGLAMNAKSKNKEAAWKLISFMFSKGVAKKMTNLTSLPWATKAGLEALDGSSDPILKVIPGLFGQDPKNNLSYPCLPDSERLMEELKSAFQLVLAGKADAKTELDKVAASWQKTIDSAK